MKMTSKTTSALTKLIASNVNLLPASGIRDIMVRASKLDEEDKEGRKCIRLEVGQPNFSPPKHVIEALSYAIKQQKNLTYCPNAGLPSLRKTIADMYSMRKNIPTTQEQIIITTGAMMSMHSLFCTLLNPHDEALLPLPGFPNYQQSVSLVGAISVPYLCRPSDQFLPRLKEIESKITEKTKLLSPGNPTGAFIPPQLTKDIVQMALEKNIFVISDEIYSDIIFDGKVYESAAKFDTCSTPEESRVAVVSGVSKGYAMTGFRVGWTRASPIIIDAMTKLQEPIVSCGSPFCQIAAQAAIKGDQRGVGEMVQEYQKRRDKALEILTLRGHAGKYKPSGAFYLPLDISSSGLTSLEFALKLLQEKRVAVAPGSAFDTGFNGLSSTSTFHSLEVNSQSVKRQEELLLLNQFVRVSLANSLENVSQGIHLICDLLDSYKTQK